MKKVIMAALLLATMLTFVLATTALAAPAAQDTAPATEDQATIAGVYVSDVYPAADASGLVQELELYENQNAQLTSVYVGKDTPVVERGTWALDADGAVVLTITGQVDQDYDKPAVTTYTVDGDMLHDGAFVLTRLPQVTPADIEAGNVPELPDEPPTNEDPTGIYVSDLYPAADASGMLQMLELFANNNAQLISFYVAKDAPIVENGTWQLTDEGAVELTITGTADQTYDKPSVTTYTRGGDELDDGSFLFTMLHEVTPTEMDAMTAPSSSDMAGVYVSKVYPAADAPGLVMVLALYANNNAEQTSIYLTKGAVVEVGTWELDAAGVLTVTLTGTTEKKYSEPADTAYTVDGDTLAHGPFELTKLPEVTAEDMNDMTTPLVEPVAVYQSDVMPAADSPGRVITLTLDSDNTVVMTTDFMNDEPPIVEIGTWEQGENDQFTVAITGTPDETYAEPDVITFEQQGDQIVAVEYDESMWGSAGLTLNAVTGAE